MKLTDINITNFKSLKDVQLTFDPQFNLLVGKNNVGKSAILDAVALLSEAFSLNYAAPYRPYEDRGGFSQLSFYKDQEAQLALAGEVSLDPSESVGNIRFGGEEQRISRVRVHVKLQKAGVQPVVKLTHEADTIELGYSTSGGVTSGGVGGANFDFEYRRLAQLFDKVRRLDAVRIPQEQVTAQGVTQLHPSAFNLIQLLNSLPSANLQLYNRIQSTIREILPEIEEVRAPLEQGQATVYGASTEQARQQVEFLWRHIAVGTRQIICLVTFVLTTPRGAMLLIEEPEVYLHPAAVTKFIDVCRRMATDEDKQFIFSTHSPLLVELFGIEKTTLCVKAPQTGETSVQPLMQFAGVQKVLRESGLSASQLLINVGDSPVPPDFVLVVEGRDDRLIWQQLLSVAAVNAERIQIIRPESGGWQEAVRTGLFLHLLNEMGIISIPYLVVLDKDNSADEKLGFVDRTGVPRNSVHVLQEKEIESYLIDEAAIRQISGRSQEEIRKAIASAGGSHGKDRLRRIIRAIGLPDPDASLKALIATHLELPAEMSAIIERAREAQKKQSV